ncbi:MAG: septum formation initiator family protein [Solirubrobacteraceae bacterium]|nr:septum formation initiator family protein [Solirubrobacteraceae bacterium]
MGSQRANDRSDESFTGSGLIPRPRLIAGRPDGSSPIRWDRIGRAVIVGVFLLVAILYLRPLVSIISARGEAADRRAEVQRLQSVNDRLTKRVKALKNPAALELEARRLGMVKPGERAYVIKGLPDAP